MAGYPSLTLPIGYTYGLPAGLHFFGRAFSEQTLLKLAYGLEQTLQARRAPEYLEEPPADYDLEDVAYPTEPNAPQGEWQDSGEWDAADGWYEEPAEDSSGE